VKKETKNRAVGGAIKSDAHRLKGGGENLKQRTKSKKVKRQAARKHGLSRKLKTICVVERQVVT
jgi:hypothetical protein